MISHLLLLLLTPPLCLQHPVNPEREVIRKLVQEEPVYVSFEDTERKERQHPQKRQDTEEEMDGDQLQSLSPEAVETLRKVNPLTIGEQVSKMLRKDKRKMIVSKKPLLKDDQSSMGSEAPEEDESYVVSPDENSLRQHAENTRPDPSRKNVKNHPSDYGYSIIIQARDQANPPVQNAPAPTSKAPQSKERERLGKERYGDPDGIHFVYKLMPTLEKIYLNENNTNHEIRVPKPYSVAPSFPVYDGDFISIPDPFNGILDENYWTESIRQGYGRDRNVNQEGTPLNPPRAKIKKRNDKVSCGDFARKSNLTEIDMQ